MLIREINEKDSENFLNFLKQLDTETINMMYEPGERKTSLEEIKVQIENLKHTNSIILLAEDNNKIVGFLSAQRGFANRIKHSAYLVIGILQNYRGNGIGQLLFEELEKWTRNNNLVRLELTVITHNEPAVRLYKKMGFQVEGLKEKSLIVDGNYADEYYMGKIITEQ